MVRVSRWLMQCSVYYVHRILLYCASLRSTVSTRTASDASTRLLKRLTCRVIGCAKRLSRPPPPIHSCSDFLLSTSPSFDTELSLALRHHRPVALALPFPSLYLNYSSCLFLHAPAACSCVSTERGPLHQASASALAWTIHLP